MAEDSGSEVCLDYKCSPCAEEGLNNEAEILCTTCNVYLCGSCTKAHDRLLKGHATTNKKAFMQGQDGGQRLNEVCSKHGGKLIDMYCEDDDMVGCAVCIALHHRGCSNIQFIPEMTTDQIFTEKLDDTQKQVSKNCQSYVNRKNDIQRDLAKNEKEKEHALDIIEHKRLEINSALDEIQGKLTSRVCNRSSTIEENLMSAEERCNTALKPLREVEDMLNKSRKMGRMQVFVAFKMTKQKLADQNLLDKEIQEMKTPDPVPVIDVMETVYGDIKRTSTALSEICEVNLIGSLNDPERQFCTLPNGLTVRADLVENKINIYAKDGELRHSIDVVDKPGFICITAENEVAFTIPKQKQVQFIVVKDEKFEKSRSFTFEWECIGICNVEDKLFLSFPEENKVGMYTLEGEPIRIVEHDSFENQIFDKPGQITCSADGSNVYVLNGFGDDGGDDPGNESDVDSDGELADYPDDESNGELADNSGADPEHEVADNPDNEVVDDPDDEIADDTDDDFDGESGDDTDVDPGDDPGDDIGDIVITALCSNGNYSKSLNVSIETSKQLRIFEYSLTESPEGTHTTEIPDEDKGQCVAAVTAVGGLEVDSNKSALNALKSLTSYTI